MAPTPERPDRGWTSAFIRFDGGLYGEDCDRVLLEVVGPAVRNYRRRGWIESYFFIRYSEEGCHVRLRLHGDSRVLQSCALPALERRLGNVARTPEGARLNLRLIPGKYEPEYTRYGGAAGVRIAEHFFALSSDVVLRILSRLGGKTRSHRLGQGLLLMLIAAFGVERTREGAGQFLAWFGRRYLQALAREEQSQQRTWSAFGGSYARQAEALVPVIDAAWTLLSRDRAPSRATRVFWEGMGEIRRALSAAAGAGHLLIPADLDRSRADAAARAIYPSYLHMTSNRLGVTIAEEAFLAYVGARGLWPQSVQEDATT